MCNQNNYRGFSGGCCHCSNCSNQHPNGRDYDDFLTPIVRAAILVGILFFILSAM